MARKKTTPKRKPAARKPAARKRAAPKRKSSRKLPKPSFSLNLQQKALVVGVVIIFLTAVLILSLLSPNQGQLTAGLATLINQTFGWAAVFVPLITGAIGLYLTLWGMEQEPKVAWHRLGAMAALFIVFAAFATLTLLLLDNGLDDVWEIARQERGGGYLGGLIIYTLTEFIGVLGALFTLMTLGLIATVIASGVSRRDMGAFMKQTAAWRPAVDDAEADERQIAINPGREDERQMPLLDPQTAVTPSPPPQEKPKTKRGRRKRKEAAPAQPEPEKTIISPVFMGNIKPGANWELPVLADLLESGTDQDVNSGTIREQVEVIEHTLESFGAPAAVVEINQGPTITQFGVEPLFIQQRSGKRTKVKVGKIAGLADDLALALAAQSIRIQAPVPGKGYIGIEVPNPDKAIVSLRDVMESKAFKKLKSPLAIGLGQDVAGQPIVAKLDAMPHVLIAGTTGSGKSVCVNGIIAALLLRNTPDDLKLVMVDPKRVELTSYNGIPHLAAPVVVEMDRVIGTLQWAQREMDNRYKMFAEVGARNILDFNKKIKKDKRFDKLPYIVIIIDELADLMMLSPEETERGITRLAQMARATGIHMVIATQRPSVDVVTGLIKANFPARIAFAVASSTDSRVILDSTGAERLLGKGDMLFQSPDAATPMRAQGSWVSDEELAKIIAYWQTARRFNLVPASESIRPADGSVPLPPKMEKQAKENRERPSTPKAKAKTKPKPPISNLKGEVANLQSFEIDKRQDEQPQEEPPAHPAANDYQQPLWEEMQKVEEAAKYEDELMPKAIELVRELNKASTSLLQRRFRVGYTRAARMMDAMEELGIIGPPTGTSKAREVLPWKENEMETAVND